MGTSVTYDAATRKHVITLTLDPEEAEFVACALPSRDGLRHDLLAAAETAREADAERAELRESAPRLVVRLRSE